MRPISLAKISRLLGVPKKEKKGPFWTFCSDIDGLIVKPQFKTTVYLFDRGQVPYLPVYVSAERACDAGRQGNVWPDHFMTDIYLTNVRPSWLQCFLLPSLFFWSLTDVQLSRFGAAQYSEVILGGCEIPCVFEPNGL